MPRHLPAEFFKGRFYRRTFSQVAPHTILGKWPTRRFVMAEGKKTPHQPRIGALKALCWDHQEVHCEVMKIVDFFFLFEITF